MNCHRLQLFICGFSQLLFLSANTYFIAKTDILLAFATSLCTNMVFCYVVKLMVFSNITDKICFSIGAAIGCSLSVCILKLLGA